MNKVLKNWFLDIFNFPNQGWKKNYIYENSYFNIFKCNLFEIIFCKPLTSQTPFKYIHI